MADLLLEALREKNQRLRRSLKRSLVLLNRVNAALLQATDAASPCDEAKDWKRTFLTADQWAGKAARTFLLENET